MTNLKIAVGFAALGCTLLSACQPQEPLTAYGTLERDRIVLTAPATEIITGISATEGQRIEKGQPLLQLDHKLQQSKTDKAQAEVQRAAAALALLVQGNRVEQIAAAAARQQQAKVQLEDHQRQLKRVRQLRQQGLSAQAELDAAELAVRLAQAQFANVQQQLQELQAGNRPELIEQAQFSLESARQSFFVEQKLLDDLHLLASRDGVLEDLPYHLGERVPQGAILAVIAANDTAYARVYLPETALAAIHIGQQVELRVDGLSDSIAGTVRKIATEASFTPYFALHQAERARLMYVTEINLPADLRLATGVPVQLILGAQHAARD